MSDPLIKAHIRLHQGLRRAASRLDDETGDVPGWVLITLMTAGLVTAIWQFAQPQLTSLFDNAIHGVSGGQ